jgi:hypothetical protein
MGAGRILILAGVALVALGLWVSYGPRLPFRLGRLPGDIHWEGKNGSFNFPVVTCLLLSAALSVAMWLVRRLR